MNDHKINDLEALRKHCKDRLDSMLTLEDYIAFLKQKHNTYSLCDFLKIMVDEYENTRNKYECQFYKYDRQIKSYDRQRRTK